MALSAKERTRLLFYFGLPGTILTEGNVNFNSVVNDRIVVIDDDENICKIARDILKKLEKFDECLEEAKCRMAASSVGDINMNKDEIRMILKERNRCIKELGMLIDIRPQKGGSNTIGVCV